ncbi:MAG: lipopolysaccharide transport periplasmic protein LptA [Gammaproteobacteria bacterium]
MAPSSVNLTPRLALLLLGLAIAGPSGPAVAARPQQPIALEAASSDFDYRNNSLRFRDVRLSQGVLRVEAAEAHATGLNFDNSQWTFSGKVRITTADGTLTSDTATVDFKDNELVRAVIQGAPATFAQQRPPAAAGGKPRSVRGRAGRIDYDLASGSVRLSDTAWLSDGANEITGRTLVYGLRDQRVLANPGEQSDERVRITIQPGAANGGAKPPPQEPPP